MRAFDDGDPIRLNVGAEAVWAARRKPGWLEYGRSICLEKIERWTLYAAY
jgi:hypothetical protein